MKNWIYLLLVSFLVACTKQNRNNRMFSGNWELERITTTTYDNNEVVSEKDTSFYGVMQLQNGPDSFEGNIAYFDGYEPYQTNYSNWNVSTAKAKTITFFLWDVDLGVNFSYTYNVKKVSTRKLILESFVSDNELNLQSKTTLEFKKVH